MASNAPRCSIRTCRCFGAMCRPFYGLRPQDAPAARSSAPAPQKVCSPRAKRPPTPPACAATRRGPACCPCRSGSLRPLPERWQPNSAAAARSANSPKARPKPRPRRRKRPRPKRRTARRPKSSCSRWRSHVILMSAIAYVIIRDARRRAPVDDEDVDAREARAAHDQSVRLQKRGPKPRRPRRSASEPAERSAVSPHRARAAGAGTDAGRRVRRGRAMRAPARPARERGARVRIERSSGQHLRAAVFFRGVRRLGRGHRVVVVNRDPQHEPSDRQFDQGGQHQDPGPSRHLGSDGTTEL